MSPDRPLLEVNGLKKHFPIRGGVLGMETAKVYAVDVPESVTSRSDAISA